jgi:hypothetical protein
MTGCCAHMAICLCPHVIISRPFLGSALAGLTGQWLGAHTQPTLQLSTPSQPCPVCYDSLTSHPAPLTCHHNTLSKRLGLHGVHTALALHQPLLPAACSHMLSTPHSHPSLPHSYDH